MAPGTTSAQPLIAKPTAQRYRRGKLPPGAVPPADSDASSDEDDAGDAGPRARPSAAEESKERLVAGGAGRVIAQDPVRPAGAWTTKNRTGGIQVALRDVKVERDGEVYVGGRREVGRTAAEEEAEARARAVAEGGSALDRAHDAAR